MQLDEALAAFKTTRSSELTPAIETLGREALDGFVPPAPKKNMEFHRAWREIALEPAKRTWCLDTIIDKLPKLRDGKEHHFGEKMDAAVERLETLCTVEPDPRIARAMIALYELRAPVMGFVPAIEALARVLVRHADDQTASVPSIAELATEEEVEEIFAATPLPKAVALDAATKARATQVKPTKRDTSALFAAVYAAPDADEPRAVLADALQEAGDPRGEFIALQLREHRGDSSDELRQRAQALVVKHGKTWLGVLRPIVYRAEMRRGFLQRLELAGSWSTSKWQELAAEPMLATVEELAAGQATGKVYATFLEGKIARTIRSVEVFDDAIWKVVSALEMPRLRELHVRGWTRKDVDERFAVLIAPWIGAHPQITSVSCSAKALSALPKAVLARLTDLGVTDDLADGVKLWAKLPKLRTLECDRGYEPIILIREGKRQYARLVSSRLNVAAPKLRKLPPAIKRIEVVNNATQAKELAVAFRKRFEVVAVRPPSGTITGVK